MAIHCNGDPNLVPVFYFRITVSEELSEEYQFLAYILPAFCTLVLTLFLPPMLLKNCSIAETLYCNGDLTFFGDPFPESLVEMDDLRKTPKLSKSWTYEDLLFRNMRARIRNLREPRFWKLLWDSWICRGFHCKDVGSEQKKCVLDYVLGSFWLQ